MGPTRVGPARLKVLTAARRLAGFSLRAATLAASIRPRDARYRRDIGAKAVVG